jgi:hypothetical protein
MGCKLSVKFLDENGLSEAFDGPFYEDTWDEEGVEELTDLKILDVRLDKKEPLILYKDGQLNATLGSQTDWTYRNNERTQYNNYTLESAYINVGTEVPERGSQLIAYKVRFENVDFTGYSNLYIRYYTSAYNTQELFFDISKTSGISAIYFEYFIDNTGSWGARETNTELLVHIYNVDENDKYNYVGKKYCQVPYYGDWNKIPVVLNDLRIYEVRLDGTIHNEYNSIESGNLTAYKDGSENIELSYMYASNTGDYISMHTAQEDEITYEHSRDESKVSIHNINLTRFSSIYVKYYTSLYGVQEISLDVSECNDISDVYINYAVGYGQETYYPKESTLVLSADPEGKYIYNKYFPTDIPTQRAYNIVDDETGEVVHYGFEGQWWCIPHLLTDLRIYEITFCE